jgi:hypothetical protein
LSASSPSCPVRVSGIARFSALDGAYAVLDVRLFANIAHARYLLIAPVRMIVHLSAVIQPCFLLAILIGISITLPAVLALSIRLCGIVISAILRILPLIAVMALAKPLTMI